MRVEKILAGIVVFPIAAGAVLYFCFLLWMANLRTKAAKQQQMIAKLPPENASDIKEILVAMDSINTGRQSQAVITGTLDNDILAFLEMNGFEVTNTYSTTSGYKYVSSTTHYVIQKKVSSKEQTKEELK